VTSLSAKDVHVYTFTKLHDSVHRYDSSDEMCC